MTRHPQDVIDSVQAAFRDVPLPPGNALWNDHCCECAETSAAYGARPWTEISLEDLLAGRETALLSETAWRYYLPSMMIWCVRAPEIVDVIQDNLVFQLAPPETQEEWAWKWFGPRASGFSGAQRQAIAAFIQWHKERQEANRAGPGGVPDHVERALAFWGSGQDPEASNDSGR